MDKNLNLNHLNSELNPDVFTHESLEGSNDNFIVSEDSAFICLPKDKPQLPIVKPFNSNHMRILRHK